MVETAECPYCGLESEPGVAYCTSCGRSVLPCPQCGSLNNTALESCSKCGSTLPGWKDSVDVKPVSREEEPYFEWEWLGLKSSYTKFGFWWRFAIVIAAGMLSVLVFLSVDKPQVAICYSAVLLGGTGFLILLLLIHRKYMHER